MLYFLFFFLDLNFIPTAFAQGSDTEDVSNIGEQASEQGSEQYENDLEYLAEVAKESVKEAVNRDFPANIHRPPTTASDLINYVHANFIDSLSECKELNQAERNEAITTLKDVLVANGFDQNLVNQLVPMDPPAADDVTSSSSGSDYESEPEKSSDQTQHQPSDSSKSKSQNADNAGPSNKKKRIN